LDEWIGRDDVGQAAISKALVQRLGEQVASSGRAGSLSSRALQIYGSAKSALTDTKKQAVTKN
jgi:hypothetical protein